MRISFERLGLKMWVRFPLFARSCSSKESIMEEENDLARFLADPENVNAFVGIGVTQSLGYGLTEDGKWGKI